jgi:hypothetical protein
MALPVEARKAPKGLSLQARRRWHEQVAALEGAGRLTPSRVGTRRVGRDRWTLTTRRAVPGRRLAGRWSSLGGVASRGRII